MPRVLTRALLMALLGGLTGSAVLIGVLNLHPEIAFDMDRRLPGRVLTGIYPPETIDGESFAWTSERALLNVQNVDRRSPWVCRVRFRGGRSADQPQPDLSLVLGSEVLAVRRATNDYESIAATLPAQTQRGLRLALTSSPTFVPGPSDPRPLGVRVDQLLCAPEPGRVVLPPVDAIVGAAVAAAVFGATFAIVGAPAAVASTLGVAAAQAVPLSIGVAPYTSYVDRSVAVALWIAIVTLGGVLVFDRWRPLSAGARLAVGFSAAMLFLKLLMLLHPLKAGIDAPFHAHRFDDVRGGHYFFTQMMPGGVEFPYAIALYVFASPWAALSRDSESILRIVVSASEAAAGLFLYWAVVSRRRDASIAALAVVLFHFLPVSYAVVGNANLTNAFGQQAALAAMAMLIAWPLGVRDWFRILALAAVVATAFLSHVSTFMLIGPTIVSAAVMMWWYGGRELLAAARSILLAVTLALLASVVLYYGRPEFFDAYRSIAATRPEHGSAASPAGSAEEARATRLEGGAILVMSLPARVRHAAVHAGDALSWPIVALALLGAWQMFVRTPGDRLAWTLGAWLLVGALFWSLGIVLPGEFGHQRQAMEFISRAVYASAPAVLVLAAAGGAWAWRAGSWRRVAAVSVVAMAGFVAARLWLNWIR